jgi:hypothetical protein
MLTMHQALAGQVLAYLCYAMVSSSRKQINPFLKEYLAGHQWFTPVILAICEAEIRRIVVQGQPGQIVHEIPSQLIVWHSGVHLSCQGI